MTQETLSNKTPSVAVQPTETPNATQKPEVSYVIGGYQGMTEAQVKKQTEELRKAGLTITFKEKYSSKKKGHVISQKPAGGRKFTTLSSVELVLTISKGIKPTPKPTRKPVPNQTVKPNKVKTSPKPSVNFSGNLDDILN
ncbi:MAG: PASTA domain-containing protein, partial [Eubacterium sp.]|nr:PASTA domain-containing protein [Eubacterium sp.]